MLRNLFGENSQQLVNRELILKIMISLSFLRKVYVNKNKKKTRMK